MDQGNGATDTRTNELISLLFVDLKREVRCISCNLREASNNIHIILREMCSPVFGSISPQQTSSSRY